MAEVVGHDEEAGLPEVEVGVGVDERVATDADVALVLELLRGGLIIRRVVGGEVTDIGAKLESEDAHGANDDVGVRAERKAG